ncbi:hypothetical protein HDV05_000823, partial [Chytridiales sp. JEL 0842]
MAHVKRLVMIVPKSRVVRRLADIPPDSFTTFNIQLTMAGKFQNVFTNVHAFLGKKVGIDSGSLDKWRLPCVDFDVEETSESFLGDTTIWGDSDLIVSVAIPFFNLEELSSKVDAELVIMSSADVGPNASPTKSISKSVFKTALSDTNHVSFMWDWPNLRVLENNDNKSTPPGIWLQKHLMDMFSTKELTERRNVLQNNMADVGPWTVWKEQFMAFALYSLEKDSKCDFMLSLDKNLDPRSKKIGILQDRKAAKKENNLAGGGAILIHVNELLFDAAAETVVLDCYICVLTDDVLKDIGSELTSIESNVGIVRTPQGVLDLWIRMLPVSIEKARGGEWGHKDTC